MTENEMALRDALKKAEKLTLDRISDYWTPKNWEQARSMVGMTFILLMRELYRDGVLTSQEKAARYVGPEPTLKGQTALVMEDMRPGAGPGNVLAQFDDFSLELRGQRLAYSWRQFPRKDFEILSTEEPKL